MKEEDFENDNDDEEEDVQIQDQESSEDLRWDGLINFADKKFDGMIHCIEGKRIKTEIKEEDEAIACQKVKSIKISTLIQNLFTCHISRIWIWTLLDLFQERQDH